MSLLLVLPLLLTAPGPEPVFIASEAGTAREPVVGSLLRITEDSAELRTASGIVKVASLISIRQVGKPIPPFPTGPMLISAAGDRIPGRITGGDDRGLSFQPDLQPDDTSRIWKVSYSALAIVWNTTPPADTPIDPRTATWIGEERRDSLRLRNGDVHRGTLESVGDVVRLKLTNETSIGSFPLSSLSAIAFNPALARVRKPREAYLHVILGNGARVYLTAVSIASGHLEGRTLFGATLRVKLAEVIAIDVHNSKAIDLSQLKPSRSEQTGYLGITRAVSLDRSSTGRAIQLAGTEGDSTFDRGLGTMPKTRLVYDLAGKYRRFETTLGLEAGVTSGSAMVRILVDGKDTLDSRRGMLTPGGSQNLSISLEGARELTLLIDFGPSGGVRSEVLWGNPRLVE